VIMGLTCAFVAGDGDARCPFGCRGSECLPFDPVALETELP
jgi:hypothetical protein